MHSQEVNNHVINKTAGKMRSNPQMCLSSGPGMHDDIINGGLPAQTFLSQEKRFNFSSNGGDTSSHLFEKHGHSINIESAANEMFKQQQQQATSTQNFEERNSSCSIVGKECNPVKQF